MSADENKKLFKRREQMWNTGDLDLVDEVFAPDYVAHTPQEEIEGPESVKGLVSKLHEAFPDFELTYDPIIADEDYVAVKVTIRGTHEGDFEGLEPTGKTVEIPAMIISRIEDGKVVAEWRQIDMMGMMQQLGVQPRSVEAEQVQLGMQERTQERSERR